MPWICDKHGYHVGPEECPRCLQLQIERLQAIMGNLCWLFTHEYKANNPKKEIPDWPTVAASTREAAEAASREEPAE